MNSKTPFHTEKIIENIDWHAVTYIKTLLAFSRQQGPKYASATLNIFQTFF